jgi:hypothetical protein
MTRQKNSKEAGGKSGGYEGMELREETFYEGKNGQLKWEATSRKTSEDKL